MPIMQHITTANYLTDATFLRSNFYEQLVEHVFISEVLQEAWYGFGKVVEVLRSEVDASGFDVVMECAGTLRHIQLKTSGSASKTAVQKVNVALSEKPSGCVIWLLRHEDPQTRRMTLRYRFFGGAAGDPLPSLDDFRTARHTKGDSTGHKAERPHIRVVPRSRFEAVETTRNLVQRLFGLT